MTRPLEMLRRQNKKSLETLLLQATQEGELQMGMSPMRELQLVMETEELLVELAVLKQVKGPAAPQ